MKSAEVGGSGTASPQPRAAVSAGAPVPNTRSSGRRLARVGMGVEAISLRGSSVTPEKRCQKSSPCRSEEHTSELQSLMRSSYAVFCLKNKKANHELHLIHVQIKKKNDKQ